MEGVAMTVCARTGITVPECSCQSCIEAQLRAHYPQALSPAAIAELLARTEARAAGAGPGPRRHAA
jgi:hypothetical protein